MICVNVVVCLHEFTHFVDMTRLNFTSNPPCFSVLMQHHTVITHSHTYSFHPPHVQSRCHYSNFKGVYAEESLLKCVSMHVPLTRGLRGLYILGAETLLLVLFFFFLSMNVLLRMQRLYIIIALYIITTLYICTSTSLSISWSVCHPHGKLVWL